MNKKSKTFEGLLKSKVSTILHYDAELKSKELANWIIDNLKNINLSDDNLPEDIKSLIEDGKQYRLLKDIFKTINKS